MSQKLHSTAVSVAAPSATGTSKPTSDARLAAVVQAAYILEARSR